MVYSSPLFISTALKRAGKKEHIATLKKAQINDFRRKVGVVFQDFRLIPDKNVYENIAFAMEAAGRTDAEIEADVPHVLDLVDLSKKIWNFPATF